MASRISLSFSLEPSNPQSEQDPVFQTGHPLKMLIEPRIPGFPPRFISSSCYSCCSALQIGVNA